MTKKKELQERIENVDGLRTILSAMKSLAFMETKKLARYLGDQGRAADTIKAVAADFLRFHPLFANAQVATKTVLIALGADHGFCGDFNEQIARTVRLELDSATSADVDVIAVGERLASRLSKHVPLFDTVGGATFAEEVPEVLTRVVAAVGKHANASAHGPAAIKIISHLREQAPVNVFTPLNELREASLKFTNPPHLTLDERTFWSALLDQYLESSLYNAFYSSLMNENTKRIRHLDSAMQRLERDSDDLKRRYNQVRQEDITEEIEIILMSVPEESRGESL